MQKRIVVSAINIFQGGALSILEDCLTNLVKQYSEHYEIIAFVHKKNDLLTDKVRFIELPKSRKSYIFRLYYEYIWFYFQSRKIKPTLWFSLHDITPNVKASIKAVYCHNPSPFYSMTWKEFFIEPKLGFFNIFYKFLYKINSTKNDFIVVQQEWLREKFKKINTKSDIVVARPSVNIPNSLLTTNTNEISNTFFYPTFPRVFKNIECLCQAVQLLNKQKLEFDIFITISGTENTYSKKIVRQYGTIKNIHFTGTLKREEVFKIMQQSRTLVFPSKLETWGLPISEAKLLDKIILVSDLPYAHETVGNYNKVVFFDPRNVHDLASKMELILNKKIQYSGNTVDVPAQPFAENWDEIFKILLKTDSNA